MLVDPVYDTENEGSKIVELQIDVKKGGVYIFYWLQLMVTQLADHLQHLFWVAI